MTEHSSAPFHAAAADPQQDRCVYMPSCNGSVGNLELTRQRSCHFVNALQHKSLLAGCEAR